MNQMLRTLISKQVSESMSKQSEEIASAICSNIPDNATTEEMLPLMIRNVLGIAVSSSVCTILDLLDSMEIISLEDDEDILRRKLLTVLKG